MRLLIVEDEIELLDAISQTFREEGYAVDVASDGPGGLFKAMTWDYDAIVLDWMLPECNGLELLKRLRIVKTTPVLMLTARDAVHDRVAGLDLGADDYLTKPFSLKELIARVRALIRRTSGQTTNIVEIEELRVDIASKTAQISGEKLDLTATEFSLLELLVLNRGKLVSRTMIYDHLFDENESSFSNLVDVHVSNLRKKLVKDWIETKRGQGYIFHA